MKIKVKCEFVLEVEVPDDLTPAQVHFVIEDNGCPGTGAVWTALKAALTESEESDICWACKLGGKNTIVEGA